MARARKAPSRSSDRTASTESTFTCPECGKTFTRAASLGAHRSRAHGVSGASARRNRGGRAATSASTTRRTRAARPTQRQATGMRSRAGSSGGASNTVDRDGLLQALFPNGLPAREDVIRQANAWLDEAERLANTK